MATEDRPSQPSSNPSAEEAFADFLARRTEGAEVDIEELCAAHPEQSAELRKLHDDWRRVEGVFERMGANATLGERIEARYGKVDPGISLEPDEDSVPSGSRAAARLERLAQISAPESRYIGRGEIARGGMGAIIKVWDQDLRRPLAMKVVLGGKEFPAEAEKVQVDPRKVCRFLEEAQITGQLDHPGVVPVHELGLDRHGRAYFTMRLVRGKSFRDIILEIHEGPEDGDEGEWTRERALGVVLKVCEAVAFAHSKRVVHRDIKPSNVMVGRYGETYVMDWGLAKVLGQDETKDIRIREDSLPTASRVHTDREEDSAQSEDAPLITMDGDVVGTPAYMAPEQAGGRVELIGPRSDIYSVGAILYHLLSGQRPYVPRGDRVSARTILNAVREGPPQRLESIRAGLPVELVSICEKAMSRELAERYAGMDEMADDLRAFLEGRVVRAHQTGAVAEFRKWVRRNRALAASIAGGILIAFVGLSGIGYVQGVGRRDAEEEQHRAEEFLDQLQRYKNARAVEQLLADADRLWPPWPDRIPELRAWLEEAGELLPLREEARQELEAMRLGSQPLTEEQSQRDRLARRGPQEELHLVRAQLGTLEVLIRDNPSSPFAPDWRETRTALDESLAALEAALARPLSWNFAEREQSLRHDVHTRFVEGLDLLAPAAARIERRLDMAESVEELGRSGETARLWREVARDHPAMHVEPQLGLRPLWRNAQGLWELLAVFTGEAPERDDRGRPLVGEDTGMVLVLLPGGTFSMGSWPVGGERAVGEDNVDPGHRMGEGPVREVTLAPFYCSKYEVTQGQWERIMGSNPSVTRAGQQSLDHYNEVTLANPVEHVSWMEAVELGLRLGLALPSEAQWEYACRAGTGTPFHTGAEVGSLQGSANIADEHARRMDPSYGQKVAEEASQAGFDDGHAFHAVVGSLDPNAFGLHDMHGNVAEWCADRHATETSFLHRAGDGLREVPVGPYQVIKGGSYWYPASHARSAWRAGVEPSSGYDWLGLRLVLTPD